MYRLDGGRRTLALDLGDRVKLGAEQGLLGIAFHPDFATDRRVYLHWSDPKGDTRVAEFRAGRDGTIAPEPLRELLHVDQPEENHNGGQLLFGPDGRLYLGLGDGGGAFDPRRTAQDPGERLGKILAADVRQAEARTGTSVLTGLRNPWRFSFDAALGELWIGDVGQDAVEEIDRVLLEPDEPPKNLGWSAFEGSERVRGHELDDGRRARLARRRSTRTRRAARSRAASSTPARRCRSSAAATSTATSARARCGRCPARPRAAPPTSAASRPRSPASPTSGRRTRASCCSPRATARSTARCPPAR